MNQWLIEMHEVFEQQGWDCAIVANPYRTANTSYEAGLISHMVEVSQVRKLMGLHCHDLLNWTRRE